jgi:two-component system response regulator MprA
VAHHLLVVENDAVVLALVLEALREEGYAVAGAVDGLEALDLVEQDPPRLLLVDLMMPRMDGATLVRLLRERGFGAPIVVLSAAYGGAEAARDLEADGFLAKPFGLGALLATVSDLLGPRGG